MRYQGTKVFIAGGSEGIGYAIASLLFSLGADVAIFSRNAGKIKKALIDIKTKKIHDHQVVLGFPVDITRKEDVKTVFERALAELGGIDVLINCAGFAYPGYFQDIPLEKFEQMMAVNYFGSLYAIRAVLPRFLKQKHGHIVNTSSLAGFLPVFGYSGYVPSKFGVLGFSEVLAWELKRFHIRVSVLCPPDTDTPGFQKENETKPAETAAIGKSAKLMTPERVALAFEKGFRKKKFLIIPGFEGKLSYYLRRHIPGIINLVFRNAIHKVQRLK